MSRIALVAIAVVVVAAVGGGAFWAGTRVGENAAAQAFQGGAGRAAGQVPGLQGLGEIPFGNRSEALAGARWAEGFERPLGTGWAGGGTMGTVDAVEGNVIILTTSEGTVRVLTADTTLVEKYMSVDVSALEVGERVTVSGSTDADGALIARSIQSLRAVATETVDQH